MRDLYYGRSGQTHDLVENRKNSPDANLTPQGWEEARRAGKLLHDWLIVPDLIVCSELPRSIQSAETVADAIGYEHGKIIRSSMLNEQCWGKAAGMSHNDIRTRWPRGIETVPGAERMHELHKRAGQAISWLRERNEDTVFVMGHGTIGRAIIRMFRGYPFADEYEHSKRDILENGQIMQLCPQVTKLSPL